MSELKVLEDLFDHHVDEEKGTGFSCARDDFDKEQLEAMARDFRAPQNQTKHAAGLDPRASSKPVRCLFFMEADDRTKPNPWLCPSSRGTHKQLGG
jgi:hypothetical protein